MKKVLAMLLAFGLGICSMAGCSSEGTQDNGGASSKGSSTVSDNGGASDSSKEKLVIWVHPSEGNLSVFNDYCKPLIEEATGMEVEYVVKSMDGGSWSSYLNSCVAALAAGEVPDIICSAIEGHQFMLSKNLLAPLDDLIAGDPEGDTFVDSLVPIAVETFRADDGHLYQLPYSLEMMGIWYNLEMFDEAGIPYIDPKEGWTWDEFLDISKKLTKEVGGGKIYGAGLQFGAVFSDYPWYLTNGATILDEGFKSTSCDSEAFQQSMKFLDSLVNEYQVAPMPSSDSTDMVEMFLSERVAMVNSGGWSVATIKSRFENKYGIAPYPKPADGKENPSTVYGMCSMGVYKDSPHKEAAWKAMKIMGSADISEKLWTIGGQSPAVSSVLESDIAKEMYPVGLDTWNVVAENMTVVPYPVDFPEIETIYQRNLLSLLNGQIDAENAAKTMKEEITTVLEDN